jgi:serine/threonine protein kinase
VLQKLDHPNIMKILEWGDNGQIKDNNHEYGNLVYLVTEYITGDNIFALIKTLHASGEEGGRYFLS